MYEVCITRATYTGIYRRRDINSSSVSKEPSRPVQSRQFLHGLPSIHPINTIRPRLPCPLSDEVCQAGDLTLPRPYFRCLIPIPRLTLAMQEKKNNDKIYIIQEKNKYARTHTQGICLKKRCAAMPCYMPCHAMYATPHPPPSLNRSRFPSPPPHVRLLGET